MLQYKIPQNVGIEDRIVGPFSLRQLIILAAGGGISYVLFVISSRLYELNILEYIIICLPALVALAAATLKIRNVTFTKFILLTLEFAIKPKKRMWDHHAIYNWVDPDLNPAGKSQKKLENSDEDKERKNVNLRELSMTLDSGGFKSKELAATSDIDQVKDEDLITQAYFGNKRKEGTGHNMYWRTREVQKKKLDILAKLPSPKKEVSPVVAPARSEVALSPPAKIKPFSTDESSLNKPASTLSTDQKETAEPLATDNKIIQRPALKSYDTTKKPFKVAIKRFEKKPRQDASLRAPGQIQQAITQPDVDPNKAEILTPEQAPSKKTENITPLKTTIPESKSETLSPSPKIQKKHAIQTNLTKAKDEMASSSKTDELPSPPKKKRRRRRKKKPITRLPVFEQTQKIPPSPSATKGPAPAPKESAQETITSADELTPGAEIEFNLD